MDPTMVVWLGIIGFGLNLAGIAVGYGRLNQKVEDLKGEVGESTKNTKTLIDLHEKRLDRLEAPHMRAPAGGSGGLPTITS